MLQRITVPHPRKGSTVRVIGGCKLPRHAPMGLKLGHFLAGVGTAFPSSPPSVDYSAKAISVIENIEGNDQYGDCVFAEDAHYIALLTGNANTLYSYTEAQALADYSVETGFNPSDPNSDQGADPIADLNYRVQKGYADGSHDAGWALVDGSNQSEVEFALSEFGNLKMWLGLPTLLVQGMGSLQNGFVWDTSLGPANNANGHCIGAAGFGVTSVLGTPIAATAQGVLVMTWGMLGIMTWEALAQWCVPSAGGGLAVRVSMDWVSKASGITPSGVNAAALIQAFNSYLGGNLPVPVTPPPAPAPSPAGSVTKAGVIGALGSAFGKAHPLLTRSQALQTADAAVQSYWPTGVP